MARLPEMQRDGLRQIIPRNGYFATNMREKSIPGLALVKVPSRHQTVIILTNMEGSMPESFQISSTSTSRTDTHRNRLRLQELLDTFTAPLAADAAALVATEREIGGDTHPAIDGDRAGAQTARNLHGALLVAGGHHA